MQADVMESGVYTYIYREDPVVEAATTNEPVNYKLHTNKCLQPYIATTASG